jgi:hypothetical protein
MRLQTLLKAGVAVLSALVTTSSLILEARGISPGTPWPYLALGGFVIFVILTVWIIWGLNQQLSDRRPRISLGQQIRVATKPLDAKNEFHIMLHPSFHNAGQKVAYQFHFHSGFAPADFPEQFQVMPDLTISNPIDLTEEFGPELNLKMPFVKQKGGARQVKTTEILMYCGIEYSDAPHDGKKYKDEWWFIYPLGGHSLAAASIENINALKPYVTKAFGQKDSI